MKKDDKSLIVLVVLLLLAIAAVDDLVLTEASELTVGEQVHYENKYRIYVPDSDTTMLVNQGYYCTTDNVLMQEDKWFWVDGPVVYPVSGQMYSCEVVDNTPSADIKKRISV